MPRIACKNCGTEITGAGAVLFCSCGTKSDAKSIDPARGLPGTELKRIIPGYLGKADCQTCKDYARTMDRWGVDGCEQRFDRIVGRLMSVANESRILRLFPNVTEPVCRDWVRRAIDNARAAEQTAPGKFSAVWVYWAGGAAGDELRYSIRSACENLGDLKNVVICGDHPGDWYTGDFIHSPRYNAKQAKRDHRTGRWAKLLDSALKLRRIIASDLVSSRFLWLYDDTFIARPTTIDAIAIPRAGGKLHAGDIDEPLKHDWREGRRRTAKALLVRGLPSRNYSTHYPAVYDKPKLTATLDEFGADTKARCIESLYYNHHAAGNPSRVSPVFQYAKSGEPKPRPVDVVNVGGFRSNFAERMHEQFPTASPAEKSPNVRASKTPAVSVVCPVKITDHYRRRNWHAWLEQIAAVSQAHEIETIVVTSGELAPVPGIKIVNVAEPFEKSRWMNAAELHANAPRLCFADVDMHLTPDAWSSGFQNANAANFYSPYSKVRWLNRAGADHAIARARYTMRGKGITKRGNLSSGVFFCDRKSFHAIGRWDERFKKWGYEDTALDHSANASALTIEIGSAIATHLWHPAPHRNRDRNESLAIFERFYDQSGATE